MHFAGRFLLILCTVLTAVEPLMAGDKAPVPSGDGGGGAGGTGKRPQSVAAYEQHIKERTQWLNSQTKNGQVMPDSGVPNIPELRQGGTLPRQILMSMGDLGTMDKALDKDEEEVKGKRFEQANYGLGWDELFDEPDDIFFFCPYTGNDPETGNELDDGVCSNPYYDALGCDFKLGYHSDHPLEGGKPVVGLDVMHFKKVCSFGICWCIFQTGSAVEYWFPWFFVNASEQKYQSSYIKTKWAIRDHQKVVRDIYSGSGLRRTRDNSLENLKDVNTLVKNDVYRLTGKTIKPGNPGARQMALTLAALSKLGGFVRQHPELQGIDHYAAKTYARNFSSVQDIEMHDEEYWYVPHFPKDTHRFGSDFFEQPEGLGIGSKGSSKNWLPANLKSSTIQGFGTDKKIDVIGSESTRYARYLNLSKNLMSWKWDQYEEGWVKREPGGVSICVQANVKDKKTPADLKVTPFTKRDDAKAEVLCMPKIGRTFPLNDASHSLYRTDAFWRGLSTAGIQMFYAIQFRELDKNLDTGGSLHPLYCRNAKNLGGDPVADMGGTMLRLVDCPTSPVHTFLNTIDKLVITSGASDQHFVMDTDAAGVNASPLAHSKWIIPGDPIVLQNTEYVNANMRHFPATFKDVQNTAYIFGLVHGPWGGPCCNIMGWERHDPALDFSVHRHPLNFWPRKSGRPSSWIPYTMSVASKAGLVPSLIRVN